MRTKVLGGIAAGVVVVAGAAVIVLVPSSNSKPSVNDIGAASLGNTGNVDVFASFGALSNEPDPSLDGNGVASPLATGQNGGVFHQLTDYSTEQTQVYNFTSSTGAAAGKVTFAPMQISLPVDSAYPYLLQNLAIGKVVPNVRIAFRKAGQTRPYLQITLKQVALDKLTLVPSDEGTVVNVGLEYGAYQASYWPQKADGTYGTVVQGGWNRVTNQSAPQP